MRDHKGKQRFISRPVRTEVDWKCSRGLEFKKKKPLHYNHFCSSEIKIMKSKMRDHVVIKSLIPGSPRWPALHKTSMKNACHSMNNLHVLCKIFIEDKCHSMNSLDAAYFE